jgi:hypothetical protein
MFNDASVIIHTGSTDFSRDEPPLHKRRDACHYEERRAIGRSMKERHRHLRLLLCNLRLIESPCDNRGWVKVKNFNPACGVARGREKDNT